MDEFEKKLTNSLGTDGFDAEKNDVVTREIGKMYDKKMKKLKIECWLRLAAAVAITVYGALGIKYNTGWYVTWALFTALVGFNSVVVIILWYWQVHARLTVLKEIKQLQLQIAELAGKKSPAEI
jgi:small-conductance mechanosensitive channel